MKRIVLWLLSTVTVVVLLFGYHTSHLRAPAPASAAPRRSGTQRRPPTTGGRRRTSRAGHAARDGERAASAAKTFTGDVAQTQWGPVQVQITVDGGTITDVDVLQYP